MAPLRLVVRRLARRRWRVCCRRRGCLPLSRRGLGGWPQSCHPPTRWRGRGVCRRRVRLRHISQLFLFVCMIILIIRRCVVWSLLIICSRHRPRT